MYCEPSNLFGYLDGFRACEVSIWANLELTESLGPSKNLIWKQFKLNKNVSENICYPIRYLSVNGPIYLLMIANELPPILTLKIIAHFASSLGIVFKMVK
jgi:hypothetical protein